MKAYLRGMINCSRHSDPFVRLFAITENVKILTQFHSFLIAVICSKCVFRLDDCRVLYCLYDLRGGCIIDFLLETKTHPLISQVCVAEFVTYMLYGVV